MQISALIYMNILLILGRMGSGQFHRSPVFCAGMILGIDNLAKVNIVYTIIQCGAATMLFR